MVSVAVADAPPADAVITHGVTTATGVVEMENDVDVLPAVTVTVAGTVAALPAVRVTVVPPLGAGSLSVTVPVELLPPKTVVGDSETLATAGGTIVRVAVWVVPVSDAEMVEVTVLGTGVVDTVKVAVV